MRHVRRSVSFLPDTRLYDVKGQTRCTCRPFFVSCSAAFATLGHILFWYCSHRPLFISRPPPHPDGVRQLKCSSRKGNASAVRSCFSKIIEFTSCVNPRSDGRGEHQRPRPRPRGRSPWAGCQGQATPPASQ